VTANVHGSPHAIARNGLAAVFRLIGQVPPGDTPRWWQATAKT